MRLAKSLMTSALITTMIGGITIAAPPDSASNAAILAPGTWWDTSIAPRASRYAAYGDKYNAVLSVARSQFNVPYVHFGNKDRGDRGFDCSNFAGYVYRHALGLRMSTASRTQASSVGWPVSRSEWRPGDLLIFERGWHVGIYIGNNQMINTFGAPGVCIRSVAPGTYWGGHLTGVKRIFLGAQGGGGGAANEMPIGCYDGNVNGWAYGWAIDKQTATLPVTIHVYIDGPAGSGGTFIGAVTADRVRSDVNRATGLPGNHGFAYPIPSRFHYQPHSLYIYALDSWGGSNPLLPGSPKRF